MFKIIYRLLFLILITSTLLFLTIQLSLRNTEEIVNKAPQFMEKQGFKLSHYIDCKNNILYGGLVEYYGVHNNGDKYLITITKWEDELMVYDIKKIKEIK